MPKPTLAEIRAANQAAGYHTFDRKTLKFFGETMKNYRVGEVLPDGTVEVIRRGGKAGSKVFIYDPTTKSVEPRRDRAVPPNA